MNDRNRDGDTPDKQDEELRGPARDRDKAGYVPPDRPEYSAPEVPEEDTPEDPEEDDD